MSIILSLLGSQAANNHLYPSFLAGSWINSIPQVIYYFNYSFVGSQVSDFSTFLDIPFQGYSYYEPFFEGPSTSNTNLLFNNFLYSAKVAVILESLGHPFFVYKKRGAPLNKLPLFYQNSAKPLYLFGTGDIFFSYRLGDENLILPVIR